MDIDMVPEGHVGARSAVLAVWRHLFGNDAPDRPIRFARQEVRDGVVVEVPTPDDARADQERGDAEHRVAVDWLLGALQRREVDAWFRDPDRNEWSMVRATYWSGKGGKGAMVGRLDGAGLQPQESALAALPWFLRDAEFKAWLRGRRKPGWREISGSECTRAMESAFWNLMQTIAWVYMRDPELVARCADDVQDHGYWFNPVVCDGGLELHAMPMDRPTRFKITMLGLFRRQEGQAPAFETTREAEVALTKALADGRLACLGIRNNVGDLVPIDPAQWSELRLHEEQDYEAAPKHSLRAGASYWFKLKFKRAEVMALWQSADCSVEARRLTAAAERDCRQWLAGLMRKSPQRSGSKSSYEDEAKSKFNVGSKAFARAWADALADSGSSDWAKPGRRRTIQS